MGRRFKLVLETIIFLGLLAIVGVLIFIYSGAYNVSATYKDSPSAKWFFSSITDHSIKNHAQGIKTPPLDDSAKVRAGASLYSKTCISCHGAPGVGIDKVSQSMNPAPPELTKEAEEWKPNEFFWIAKNGIRMSGMPAWGKIMSDNDIWAITAFAQKIKDMDPAEYKALTSATSSPTKRL